MYSRHIIFVIPDYWSIKYFVKGQVINNVGFERYPVSFPPLTSTVATQSGIDNIQINVSGCGCIPIKIYMQKQSWLHKKRS